MLLFATEIYNRKVPALIRKIYVDKEWVAQEYLRQCKVGAWKAHNTTDVLKCWNLERIIDAQIMSEQEAEKLKMAEFVGEVENEVELIVE